MTTLEIAVRQTFAIRLGDRSFYIEFPVAAVAKLEEQLGRSMKTAADWFRIETRELPEILRAGLSTRHAADAENIATAICEGLDPEGIEETIEALCAATFPRAMERLRAELERYREKAKRGEPVPNAPSATVR